jgi:site-specific recombinase XerC
MCYKSEVQKKNEEKLKRRFENDGTPDFIQRLFVNLGRSKATSITYWIAIKDLLQYMIDNSVITKEKISDIKPNDMLQIEAPEIQMYLEYKEMNGMSPSTLQIRKNIFKSFWGKMVGTMKVPVNTNVINDVSYKGISYNQNNVLLKLPSQEDIDEMIDRIKWKKDDFVRERNLTVMSLLMGTGLRESELAGLDMLDLFLDEENPYIKIIGKGQLREQESRIVFLSEDETVDSLKHWLDIRNSVKDIVDVDALLINRNGKRMVEDNIKSMFRNYSKGRISPHQIRHWYTTIFSQKYGTAFVQQQLGHRSINTTINNYMDARLSVLKEKSKKNS